jgi:hypothetical protein
VGVGGRPFRTNRRLLAMSALMSAGAYFCVLPSRPATCSSIASSTALLCAALVLEDMYGLGRAPRGVWRGACAYPPYLHRLCPKSG